MICKTINNRKLNATNMENIFIGEWKIEYDRNKTIEAYNKCAILIEGCDCQSCQNYYNASHYFTDEIKTLTKETIWKFDASL